MLLYNPNITPPKYYSSATYPADYYLGEDYKDVPYIVDTEGYESIESLVSRMDNLTLSAYLSKSKLVYDEDDDPFDNPNFDLSDIDEAADAINARRAEMSKPNEPLTQPSNNSPQRGGAGSKIASATTSLGESTEDVSQA